MAGEYQVLGGSLTTFWTVLMVIDAFTKVVADHK